MSGKKIKLVDGIGQKSMQEAVEDFMRHCRLKNLSAATLEYYQEDLEYFTRVMQIKYVSEFSREVLDNFVDHEMNKGNRVSAINTRIRGLQVFVNYRNISRKILVRLLNRLFMNPKKPYFILILANSWLYKTFLILYTVIVD